jgi:outer membrane protein TolC
MRSAKGITAIMVLSSALVIRGAWAEDALQWEDCVKEAKKNHPDLISAKEKLNQAIASKEVTRSPLLPQITSSASRNDSQGSGSGTLQRKHSTSYAYSVTGEQLLFDGFKTSYDLSQAERNVRASRYNYDVTSSDIRLRLRTAFVDLLSAQELLKVTESIAERRKQNMDLVKLRYEGGREHKGSRMTSEADLAEAEFEVQQAKRSIYVSQHQLIKELGRKGRDEPLAAQGDLEVRNAERQRPDFEGLAGTNPFLKELIAQKEAARYGLSSARAQFFPQVYVSGSAGKSDSDLPPERTQWSLGGTVSLPIFEGGSRFANVSKAKAAFRQAEADERSGRDGVIFTLVDMWTKFQDAIDKVEVQRKFLEAAGERARIAEAEYSTGLLTFDNWIIIEDNLVSAKKNYLNAQTDALIAEASWVQAKGGTLDYDQK